MILPILMVIYFMIMTSGITQMHKNKVVNHINIMKGDLIPFTKKNYHGKMIIHLQILNPLKV